MKSSATDADSESASFAPIYVVDGSSPEKRAQKCAGDFSVPFFNPLDTTLIFLFFFKKKKGLLK